jgi:hypothetical protein
VVGLPLGSVSGELRSLNAWTAGRHSVVGLRLGSTRPHPRPKTLGLCEARQKLN